MPPGCSRTQYDLLHVRLNKQKRIGYCQVITCCCCCCCVRQSLTYEQMSFKGFTSGLCVATFHTGHACDRGLTGIVPRNDLKQLFKCTEDEKSRKPDGTLPRKRSTLIINFFLGVLHKWHASLGLMYMYKKTAPPPVSVIRPGGSKSKMGLWTILLGEHSGYFGYETI